MPPTLNSDILVEVVESLLEGKLATRTEKLEKFMISGKRQFEAALTYFSRTNCVTVNQSSIVFHVKKCAVRLGYDHALLHPLLKVIGEPLKELVVKQLPSENDMLEEFIIEGLEKIVLKCPLPDELKDRFKSLTSLKEVSLGYNSDITTIYDLIPQCETLEINLDFQEDIAEVSPSIVFPAVKNLKIEGSGEEVLYMLTMDMMTNFHEFTTKTFPNLATLNVNYQMGECYWEDYFDIMEMCIDETKNLHWDVKGQISFTASDPNYPFYYVMNKIDLNENVIIDSEEGTIEVEKDIQDGLTFRYFMKFRHEEHELFDDLDFDDEKENGEEEDFDDEF